MSRQQEVPKGQLLEDVHARQTEDDLEWLVLQPAVRRQNQAVATAVFQASFGVYSRAIGYYYVVRIPAYL